MTTEFRIENARFDNARDELIRLTGLYVQCTSALQSAPYDAQLRGLCEFVLARGEDADIESALAYLKDEEPGGFEKLLTVAEECSEAVVDEHGAAVLMLIPIMTWSRYSNFYGEMAQPVLDDVADCVREYFCAPTARVILGSHMISPDHLPDAMRTVRILLEDMRRCAHTDRVDISSLIEEVPPPDFADVRYLVCCVAADKPEELFRPQGEVVTDVARAMMNFCLKMHDILDMTMLGSVFEVQPPGGYYYAWRESEGLMRTWGLKSLVDFAAGMGYLPEDLIATLAMFVPNARETGRKASELRISLTPKKRRDIVICGVAWATLAGEADDFIETAYDVLALKGVTDVVEQEQSYAMEWSEDSGLPMYVTPDGLVVPISETEEHSGMPFAPTLN